MTNKKRVEQVVIYTAPACAHCQRAKRFLRESGIPFREMDVTASQRARKQLQSLGARGVPVLLVGAKRMDGFDPKRFLALYRG
jgi:glutaredoxin